MIRWIADDKNCEPRKKTSLKSVVRKSQVTGDVCPENIHPRSLLIARSNTRTHTYHSLPRFMTLFMTGGRCSVERSRMYESKAYPRTSIVGATQNFQVILNICQTGAAKRGRANGGMFEGGRCTSSTMAPPPVKWSYECLPRYYVWVWPVIYAP